MHHYGQMAENTENIYQNVARRDDVSGLLLTGSLHVMRRDVNWRIKFSLKWLLIYIENMQIPLYCKVI